MALGAAARRAAPALSIAAAAIAVYLPALGAGFVFDDHVLVEESALLRGPLSRIWTGAGQADYWPVTFTALWAQWRVFGAWAPGYHAVSVALHAAVAVLLWRVLRALDVRGAWLAGLLFAVHPVAVESVAWISEQKNTLSGVLFLGTVLVWLRHERTGRRSDVAVALALFALALLAKASVVTAPFVLLGIAVLRRGALDRRDVARAAPFFALAAALGAVTAWFQWTRAMGEAVLSDRGAAERIGGAGWALASYLEKAFLPLRLGFVYPEWPVGPNSPLFFAPLVVLVGGFAALWRLRGTRARPVLLALGYHAVMLIPVLGLVDMAYLGIGPVSNHLQYLALMGPVALVAATLARAGARTASARGAAAVAVLLAGAVAFTRAAAFKDDFTLWRAAARATPDNLFAAWMYADQLGERGRRAEAMEVLAGTGRARDEATRLRARGLWLLHAGRFGEALEQVERADRLRPNGEYQLEMGQLLTRAGRPDEALRVLGPLVARAPRNVDFRYALAVALTRAGRPEEAAEVLRGAVAVAPDDARAREALALVLVRLGRADEARPHIAAARGLDAASPEVAAELARLREAAGAGAAQR